MLLKMSYPHIEKKKKDVAHLKRLPRIRVAQIVMDYLTHGWSVDEICRQYPHLLHAEVHSAMGYYYDHQEEIDEEIAAELKRVEEDKKKPLPTGVLKLKAEGLI